MQKYLFLLPEIGQIVLCKTFQLYIFVHLIIL